MKARDRIHILLDTAEQHRLCAVAESDADRHMLRRRVKTGELIMPRQGMYMRASTWNALTYHEKSMRIYRTVCKLHTDWVLCSVSAAAVYGYTSTWHIQRYVHIGVSKRSSAGKHGYVVAHHLGDTVDFQVVDGVKVTTPMRTLFDCARMLDFENAMVICSMGLRKLQQDRTAFQRYVNGFRRKEGQARARYVAARAEPLCENGGEVAGLCRFYEFGYMPPRHQVTLHSPISGRDIRPDYLWRRDDGSWVAAELDGKQKYIDPSMTSGKHISDVIIQEKDRETELNLLSVDVIRFRMEHVRHPEQLQKLLEAARIPLDPNPDPSPFLGFRTKAY